jgi:hypothetical protein
MEVIQMASIGRAAVFAAGLALTATQAFAQVQLVPATVPRFDMEGQVGWTNVGVTGLQTFDTDYTAPSASGSVGIGLTRHVSATFGAGYSGHGSLYSNSVMVIPGQTTQYTYSEHRFQTVMFRSAIRYQFFENRWVHPSVAIGAQVARETDRVTTQGMLSPGGVPLAAMTEERQRSQLAPFISAGVKFYVAERLYIRTGLDVTLAARDRRIAWMSGVGVDF